VGFWVGPKFVEAIPVVRLLILAAPPYLFYMALRSSIDSITVKPRNAGNVLVGVVIYLALTGATLKFLPANYLLEGIAGSLVVALVVLGILTARTFDELYHLSIAWGRCVPSLLAAIGLGAASLAFRWVQGSHTSLVLTVAFELLISGLFLGALFQLGSPWLGFVWDMAFPGRKLAGFAAKSRAA
jgi:FtsH-binding integral membrane protein